MLLDKERHKTRNNTEYEPATLQQKTISGQQRQTNGNSRKNKRKKHSPDRQFTYGVTPEAVLNTNNKSGNTKASTPTGNAVSNDNGVVPSRVITKNTAHLTQANAREEKVSSEELSVAIENALKHSNTNDRKQPNNDNNNTKRGVVIGVSSSDIKTAPREAHLHMSRVSSDSGEERHREVAARVLRLQVQRIKQVGVSAEFRLQYSITEEEQVFDPKI